jgi:hypothetical protein
MPLKCQTLGFWDNLSHAPFTFITSHTEKICLAYILLVMYDSTGNCFKYLPYKDVEVFLASYESASSRGRTSRRLGLPRRSVIDGA